MSTPNDQYSDPKLRERIKEKVKKEDRGGRPGQWSARKAQLLKAEYEKAGGGYRGGKSSTQKNLSKWSKEDWQTADGSGKARGGKTTKRYLPKQAWDALSPAEKRETEKKKEKSSRSGKQFVANTGAAKKARKKATTKKKAAGRKQTATKKKTTGRKQTATKKKTTGRKQTATKKKTTGRKTAATKKKATGRKKTATGRKKTATSRKKATRR